MLQGKCWHKKKLANFPQFSRSWSSSSRLPLPVFLIPTSAAKPILDRRKICGFNLSDDSFNQRSGRQIWLTHPSLLEKLLRDFEKRAGNASAVTICQVWRLTITEGLWLEATGQAVIYSVRSFRGGQDSIPSVSSDVYHVAQNAAICFKRPKSVTQLKTQNWAVWTRKLLKMRLVIQMKTVSANIARSLPILHFCLRERKCGSFCVGAVKKPATVKCPALSQLRRWLLVIDNVRRENFSASSHHCRQFSRNRLCVCLVKWVLRRWANLLRWISSDETLFARPVRVWCSPCQTASSLKKSVMLCTFVEDMKLTFWKIWLNANIARHALLTDGSKLAARRHDFDSLLFLGFSKCNVTDDEFDFFYCHTLFRFSLKHKTLQFKTQDVSL